MKFIALFFTLSFILFSCNAHTQKELKAKFEPKDGEVLLFVGQDLEAVGGLEEYNSGYFDYFQKPAGWTMYTNLRPGDTSFNHVYQGLDGLVNTDNWGSGDCNIQLQIDDEDFTNSALAIGLELVNHDSLVAAGAHDEMIEKLALWIKSQGRRPVFLRIGYEFDGHQWNHYNAEYYIKSFQRVTDIMRSFEVDNVVTVWQSKGWGSDREQLLEYYPGDEYVDWFSYSHFSRGKEGQVMIDLAREHGKPLMIAEATPMVQKDDSTTYDIYLDIEEQASLAWEEYFKPLFKVIDDNPDVIKALSYINIDWYQQAMWKENPSFYNVDSRLQINEEIRKNWNIICSRNKYIKASDQLFEIMWDE